MKTVKKEVNFAFKICERGNNRRKDKKQIVNRKLIASGGKSPAAPV